MRAPFIALLPLFAYSLFKCQDYKLRFTFLTLILSILLFLTHHLAYFLIPVFIGYFIVVISYTFKKYIKSIEVPEKFIAPALIIGFLIMFAIPFQTGHFIVGSKYAAPTKLFFDNLPRYVGVLLIFAFGGLTYLLFKHDKKLKEWSLLLIMLFLTPFLYAQTYMKWFIPCFIFPLVGVGLINILKSKRRRRRYAILVVIIFLVLSVSFSGFYQHWRTKGGVHLFDNYMKESTYTSGLWIKEDMNNGSFISNDIMSGNRVFAVSGVPLFTGSSVVDQVYGFANVSELELKKKSIKEEDYWFNGPYRLISWESELHRREILRSSYESYETSRYSKFNFTHVIEDTRIPHGSFTYHGINPSKFLEYIYGEKSCTYDNGNVNIWFL